MGKTVRGVLHIKAPAMVRKMDRRVESDSCGGVDCTIVAGYVVPQCVLVGLAYDATNWPELWSTSTRTTTNAVHEECDFASKRGRRLFLGSMLSDLFGQPNGKHIAMVGY
jgi:hypothetical protein